MAFLGLACAGASPPGGDGAAPDSAPDVGLTDAAGVAEGGLDVRFDVAPGAVPDAPAADVATVDVPTSDSGLVVVAPIPLPALDAAPVELRFPFTPSNVAVAQLRLRDGAGLDHVVVDGPQCALESQAERVWIACTANSLITSLQGYRHIKIRNGDEPALDILVARSWSIRSSLKVKRLILVALETITIDGQLTADGGGGFWSSQVPTPPWSGPGAGAAGGSFSMGGGGGSFCGTGGKGVPNTLGRSAAYGSDVLVPALAGSAGGTAGGGAGGDGGGFLQLVAGVSIVVGAGGKVTSGGGGGWSRGSGGGSGGGLLLEAPVVRILGALTANGGGGGGSGGGLASHGENARADATPAAGGLGSIAATTGGRGGAGALVDGEDALPGEDWSGGGGGAGRIRINTASSPEITGVVSPAASTPCTTSGPLAP